MKNEHHLIATTAELPALNFAFGIEFSSRSTRDRPGTMEHQGRRVDWNPVRNDVDCPAVAEP